MSIENKKLKKYFKKEAQDASIIYQRLDKSGYLKMFRDGWLLPPIGLSNQNSYGKWRVEFLVKPTNRLVRSKKYREMEKETQRLKMKLKEPLFKFNYDIEAIMTALHIPERYKAFVELSLALKSPPDFFMIKRHMPRPKLVNDPNTGRKKLIIEAYGDTKLKDFSSKLFQHEFKKLQEKLYDYKAIKQLGTPNLEMYEKIYDWHFRDKKTYKEIQELASAEGYTITYEKDVGTLLDRYKKLIGVNTRKSKK